MKKLSAKQFDDLMFTAMVDELEKVAISIPKVPGLSKVVGAVKGMFRGAKPPSMPKVGPTGTQIAPMPKAPGASEAGTKVLGRPTKPSQAARPKQPSGWSVTGPEAMAKVSPKALKSRAGPISAEPVFATGGARSAGSLHPELSTQHDIEYLKRMKAQGFGQKGAPQPAAAPQQAAAPVGAAPQFSVSRADLPLMTSFGPSGAKIAPPPLPGAPGREVWKAHVSQPPPLPGSASRFSERMGKGIAEAYAKRYGVPLAEAERLVKSSSLRILKKVASLRGRRGRPLLPSVTAR